MIMSTSDSTNIEPRQSVFQAFDNVAGDNVQALAYNSPGDRIAVASADHKLRAYNRQLLATIGNDNKFKIWREDSAQAHTRGRRFRCIFSQAPPDHVSYAAFDFIVRDQDLHLALISQSGLLSLLEPGDTTSLNTWREMDALYPFGQLSRGDEPRFDLSFHHASGPSSQALRAGLDPSALALAVSSANRIRVYRAMKSEEDLYQLHEVGQLPVDVTHVNAVAWAPGCVNPIDIIAIACDDSTVRIVEMRVLKLRVSCSSENQPLQVAYRLDSASTRSLASGITAGLADVSRTTTGRSGPSTMSLKHDVKEVAVLPHQRGVPVHRLKWNLDGTDSSYLSSRRRTIDDTQEPC
ncbi:MAG: hypothetical protein Q9163_004315 [Psora crenata]